MLLKMLRKLREGLRITTEEESVRRVFISAPSPYIDNTVTTSKYNLFSFLPLALFGQFRRFANLYFLLIGLLMFFGESTHFFLSPYLSSTTLVPLAIVISVSLVSVALTDMARHRADDEVNHRQTQVLNPTAVIKQHELRTGNIVRVINGEQIPADIVIISTSSKTNTCYIDTASIDGETSLKIRRVPQLERPPSWMREAAPKDEAALHENLGCLVGYIECDLPNENVAMFNGNLKLEGYDRVSICKDHVVLRGSSLHTDWLLGIVVYTGSETKLALNARTPPQKLARLDKICNGVVLAIFSCQIALAVFTAVLRQQFELLELKNLWYVGYLDKSEEQAPYLKTERWPDLKTESAPMKFFWSFCTFLILYCNFIPLSLYISLELAFVMLVNFVNWDMKMYHSKTDTPALARSPTVTDLGQVQYVFSDKTGTLTRNEMKLRRLIVHGVIYIVVNEDTGVKEIDVSQESLSQNSCEMHNITLRPLKTIKSLARQAVDAEDDFAAIMLESLMLCNTVVVEDNKAGGFKYQAESPDEGALVEGGAVAGYTLCSRTEHTICGTTPVLGGKQRTWQVLATNDFDNDRKRMSIFLKERDDSDGKSRNGSTILRGRILLLCKGADNSMLSRAAPTNSGIGDLRRTLDAFATEGLRTLIFGVRVFTDEEYSRWRSLHYSPAVSAMHNRDALLNKAASEAEKHLTIVGATAIEDKLQSGVPETIATLFDAGIKLWVLTGDKRETAIEIGKSCHLLRPGMPLAILNSSSKVNELQTCLLALYQATGDLISLSKDTALLVSEKVKSLQRDSQSATTSTGHSITWDEDAQRRLLYVKVKASSENIPKRALVVDGEAMHKLFGDPAIEAMLFAVLAVCDAVIACRVTPKQKAQLVLLVHEHVVPTPVTLAIGDGANDVNMIMSAQVGVGISGHEGLQAVNASDFAIAQFRFLCRLLLIHGRWGYRRICVLILYSFFKNACLAATLFFYCLYTGFSGTSLFSDYFTASFNFFLFLMIYYTSILDQDVDSEYIEDHPQLYVSGRSNLDLNVPLALKWIFLSSVHAAVVFVVPAFALKLGTGSVHDVGAYYPFGAVISMGLVMTMNVKVLFETRYFSTPSAAVGVTGGHLGCFASTWFAFVFNVGFFYSALLLASIMGDNCQKEANMFQLLPFWNIGQIVIQKRSSWFCTVLVIVACCATGLIQSGLDLFIKQNPVSISIEQCRISELHEQWWHLPVILVPKYWRKASSDRASCLTTPS